jgi:hypothetical protein
MENGTLHKSKMAHSRTRWQQKKRFSLPVMAASVPTAQVWKMRNLAQIRDEFVPNALLRLVCFVNTASFWRSYSVFSSSLWNGSFLGRAGAGG